MKYVILHNVRSSHNVGSIFRTADGAGVEKIFLTGYTPTPVDRFGRVVEEIKKTSLGATESVEWEHHKDIEEVVQMLKRKGVTIVAVEQHPRATNFKEYAPKGNIAYIFGNEVEGVPEEVIQAADAVIEVPMKGEKESLNVAVTVGIILFLPSASGTIEGNFGV